MLTPIPSNFKPTQNWRFFNKDYNTNERTLIKDWWLEQIKMFGQEVNYYQSQQTLTGSDLLYGEDIQAGWEEPRKYIMICSITNDSILLNNFGIMTDADLIGYIHIDDFAEEMTGYGISAEPRPGDLIQLEEYGRDRPSPRNGPIFQITEKDDEYLPENNALGGHYVWYIKAKRFENSSEIGAPTEGGQQNVNDDTEELEELSEEIFNYDEDCITQDGVYGDY